MLRINVLKMESMIEMEKLLVYGLLIESMINILLKIKIIINIFNRFNYRFDRFNHRLDRCNRLFDQFSHRFDQLKKKILVFNRDRF